MRKRVLVSFLFFLTGVIAGLLMAILGTPELRDYLTLAAGTIALLALVQTWLSSSAATTNADLAKMNEERKKYCWSIVLHPDGGHYVLRNTGTFTARDVRLVIPGEFGHAAFLQHDGDSGPQIPPNQSKAFKAEFPWSSRGTEIQVDWLPDGEHKRQLFNDVVQPTPDRVAEYETKVRQRLDEQHSANQAAVERYAMESRRLLIELGDAWATYQADSSAQNKIRVQVIVGALPTNFAREIGYQVDVPRDFWGNDQWPPELWVGDRVEDQALLRENAAVIELLWNLRQVQIPVFVEPDLSQPPDPWPRIEKAIYGFRDLVRQRESGEREYRRGKRDREQREDVDRRFKEFNSRIEATD
jgi:hypothetical protein